jgi:fermentation-respiration switch protein FrsA (DUF1100 family)
VLAINGDRDTQVIADMNLKAIERLLPKSAKSMVKLYPGLNHLFQHATTGLPAEYGQIEETFAPEALTDIANWLKAL